MNKYKTIQEYFNTHGITLIESEPPLYLVKKDGAFDLMGFYVNSKGVSLLPPSGQSWSNGCFDFDFKSMPLHWFNYFSLDMLQELKNTCDSDLYSWSNPIYYDIEEITALEAFNKAITQHIDNKMKGVKA